MKRKYKLILAISVLVVAVYNIIIVGFIYHQFPVGILALLLAGYWFYAYKKDGKENDK